MQVPHHFVVAKTTRHFHRRVCHNRTSCNRTRCTQSIHEIRPPSTETILGAYPAYTLKPKSNTIHKPKARITFYSFAHRIRCCCCYYVYEYITYASEFVIQFLFLSSIPHSHAYYIHYTHKIYWLRSLARPFVFVCLCRGEGGQQHPPYNQHTHSHINNEQKKKWEERMCERYCGGIHIIRVFRGIRHCIFQPTDTRVCTSTGWIGIDIGVLCALRHFLFCTIFLWVAVPPVFSFGYVFSVCLCDLYLMFAKQFLYIKIDDLKSEREREKRRRMQRHFRDIYVFLAHNSIRFSLHL